MLFGFAFARCAPFLTTAHGLCISRFLSQFFGCISCLGVFGAFSAGKLQKRTARNFHLFWVLQWFAWFAYQYRHKPTFWSHRAGLKPPAWFAVNHHNNAANHSIMRLWHFVDAVALLVHCCGIFTFERSEVCPEVWNTRRPTILNCLVLMLWRSEVCTVAFSVAFSSRFVIHFWTIALASLAVSMFGQYAAVHFPSRFALRFPSRQAASLAVWAFRGF